jgi:hypothetical protein
MKIRNPDVTRKDWELCRTYLEELKRKGFSAYEPWELELETWLVNPSRQPRKSTVDRLRVRYSASLQESG